MNPVAVNRGLHGQPASDSEHAHEHEHDFRRSKVAIPVISSPAGGQEETP